MKIYAISDLHLSGETVSKPMDIFGSYTSGYIEEVKNNWNTVVEENDIVLIAGDISWATYLKDAKSDLDFISSLQGIKILVRGNHDYWWKNISGVRAALKRNIFALQNDSIRVDGFVICGTRGWVVPNPLVEASAEDLKIFNREIERLKLSLKSTSAQRKDGDILIVMMHYPPFGDSLGDSSFTSLFEEYKVSKVVYGHLHGNHIQIPLYIEKGTVEYYLTSCDKVNNTLVRIG